MWPLQGTDKCGDAAEMEKAEASEIYAYKRAYFKIVQGLINDFRFWSQILRNKLIYTLY